MPALPQQPGQQEQQTSPLPQVPTAQAPPPAPPALPRQQQTGNQQQAPLASIGTPKGQGPAQGQPAAQQTADWQQALPAIAQRHGVDPELLRRLTQVESAGNPTAKDYRTGTHRGLGQLSPALVKQYGIDPNDPLQNLGVTASELGRLLKKYNNNYGRAVAAYNAGEGVIDKLPMGHLPDNGETPNYVMRVLEGYQPPQTDRQQTLAAIQSMDAEHRQTPIELASEAILGTKAGPWVAHNIFGRIFDPLTQQEQAGLERKEAIDPETAQMLRTHFNAQGIPQAPETTWHDPEMLARALQSSATQWYSPGQMAMRWLPGGAQAAAGAGFAGQQGYDLYANWANMSPAERTAAIMGLAGGLGATAHGGAELFRPRTATPTVRQNIQPSGTTQAPRPTPVQIAPAQERNVAVEGGPQQVTQAGQTAAQEVTGRTLGAQIPAAASAPIERSGVSGGAPTQEPRPQGPAAIPPSSAGPAPMPRAGEPEYQTAPSTAEDVQRRIGQARAAGLMPDLRSAGRERRTGTAGPPAEGERRVADEERRRQQQEVMQGAVLDQLRGELGRARTPEDRLRVERNIADLEEIAKEGARAGAAPSAAAAQPSAPAPAQAQVQAPAPTPAPPAPATAAGNVLATQAIMRSPELLRRFQSSSPAEQRQMIAEVGRRLANATAAQGAALGGTSAQGTTGSAQTTAPATTQPAGPAQQPVRGAQEPARAPGQPVRPQPAQPVREPVRQGQVEQRTQPQPTAAKPAPKPYQPLPPEQRPRMSVEQLRAQREGREAPPASPVPAEPKPATPRPEGASAEQLEAWKGTRRQEATERAGAMKEAAQYAPSTREIRGEQEPWHSLGRTLTRFLKGERTGTRGEETYRGEVKDAVERVRKQGPEAVKTERENMQRRADRARAMAEWGRAQLDPKRREFIEDARGKLTAGAVGQLPEAYREWAEKRGLAFDPRSGAQKAASWRGDIASHTREAINRALGNQMKEVGTRTELSAEDEKEVANLERKRDELVQEIRRRAKPTDRQLDQLETLIVNINARRGISHIAERGPQAQVAEHGGLEPSVAANQEMWNRFMDRPVGEHGGRPSDEAVRKRIAYLEREGELASGVAKQLGTGTVQAEPEAQKAPPAAEAAKEAPKEQPKVDAQSLAKAAGLVYKGELTPGSGAHQFEDQRYPGHTMAVNAKDIPETGAVKYLRDQMASRIEGFRENPSPLKTAIPTEAGRAGEQLAKEGTKPGQERPPKQPKQFGLPTEAQARELKEVRALMDKGDLQGALSRVRKLREAGEIEHPLDMGDWKGWPTGRLVTALEHYLDARVQGKSHKEGIEAIWQRLGRPTGSATNFEGIEDPLKDRAATTSEKPADTEREALLKRIAELEAQAKGAEKPATPEASARPHAAEELTRMVGEERPQPSAEAMARYDAQRAEVHEEFAREAKEYLDKKREVQQMRSVEPKDYTPAFLDKMEKYGKGLKELEGQSEYLAKVREARTAFESGDRKATHAAVQSALGMADGKLIKPELGKMPVKPSAGWSTIEPEKVNKAKEPTERLQKLQARIDKLPVGEDKKSLLRRHATVQGTFEDLGKQIEDLSERIKWTTQAIKQMEKRGETSRQFTTKEGKKGVQTIEQARKNLAGMETQRMLLGRDRQVLVREQLPSLEAAIGAFEKRPVPKPAQEPAAQIGPTTADVYSPAQPVRNASGRITGYESPKIGEKTVQPAEPLPSEGRQGKINQLLDQYDHLANTINKGWGGTRSARELLKGIRTLERDLGVHAPAPRPGTKEILEGEGLLKAAGRAETKPAKATEFTKYQPVDDPAGELAEKLIGAGLEPGPIHDQIEKGQRQGAMKGREMIARPIMDAVDADELEPLDAQQRYQRALQHYVDGLKMEQKYPDLPRTALKRAIEYAKTGVFPERKPGELAKGKPGEAGFISLGGKKTKLTERQERAKNWLKDIPSSMRRNREAQNLFNRKADIRSMNKGDVFEYYNLVNNIKISPDVLRKVNDYREEKLLQPHKRTGTLNAQEESIMRIADAIVGENTRIIRKLAGKPANFTEEEIAGLTHRVMQGKGDTYEKWLKGSMKVVSGKELSTFASSRMRAKYVAMEDAQSGNRMIVRVANSGKVYAYGAGQKLGGSIGLKSEFENGGFQFKRATSNEIEEATGKRYYHDALFPNIAQNIALRRAERAYDLAEGLKDEPEFQRMSTTNEDVAKTMGFRKANVANREWLPQFKGYYFEPHVAEVLEKEYKTFQEGDFSAYERASNWLKRSIFWNPLLHVPNITVHWQGEKGLLGMATQLFSPSEWRAHQRAFDVLTDPMKYHQMLEAGLPMMRQPNVNDVTNLFVAKATKQLAEADPNSHLTKLAKSLGYVDGKDMAKKLFNPLRGASEVTWAAHDYAILQATFSRMEKHGWDLKTAADEVTKHIPNYRMPPRVWNSRLLGKLMDTPGLSMFSQYHYGAFKSYGEMAKELVKPVKPGDRGRAFDRMLALGFVTYVLYPQMDKLAKYMTGRSTAVWRRAGSSTFVYNVGKLANSLLGLEGPKMAPVPFAESVVTPAPLVSAATKALQAKELTQPGMPIKRAAGKAAQIGAETIGAVAGYESGQQTPGKGEFSWRQFLFKMLGGRDEKPVGVVPDPGTGRPRGPHLARPPRMH